MNNLAQHIKKANRDFYDIVGSFYEVIDGRRSERLISYVEEQLKTISRDVGAYSIIDLGCGSGFVSRIARDYFKQRFALDISHRIMSAIDDSILFKIVADTDTIPIKDDMLQCVVTFAVLHHCYSYEKILSEIYRILKTGGIYYSDHDMDSCFFNRFRPFLKIYRKINNAGKHYLARFRELTEEMYNLSEFHQNGIPSETIETVLRGVGFKNVRVEYHWFGLSQITDTIFGKKIFRRGFAPLVRITAIK